MISRELLELHTQLRLDSPRLSNRALVKSLSKISRDCGRSALINVDDFNHSSREYRIFKECIYSGVPVQDRIRCRCCGGAEHCRWIQVDGNFKLFCYRSSRKSYSPLHHFERNNTECQLFLAADQVADKMDKLYSREGGSNTVIGSTCGSRTFKALQDTPTSHSKIITGCAFSVCPHSLSKQLCHLRRESSSDSRLFWCVMRWTRTTKLEALFQTWHACWSHFCSRVVTRSEFRPIWPAR